MDELKKLLSEEPTGPSKTYSELLEEGHPHKGGLAQLASAEKAGTLFGSTGAPDERSPAPTSTKKR